MTRPTGSAASRNHSPVAARGQWAAAYARLSARDVRDLTAEEPEGLADAARLMCQLDQATTLRPGAYAACADAGDHRAPPVVRRGGLLVVHRRR